MLPCGSSERSDALGGVCWASSAPGPDISLVSAPKTWLEAARITSGPLFRSIDRHGNVKAEWTSG